MPNKINQVLLEIKEMALEFLNGIVAVKTDNPSVDLQEVFYLLPKYTIELGGSIELLRESINSLREDLNNSNSPSQPVQQAGIRREQKRLVNGSDDENEYDTFKPKASTPSKRTKHNKQKKNKDDESNDYLEPDHLKSIFKDATLQYAPSLRRAAVDLFRVEEDQENLDHIKPNRGKGNNQVI